MLHVVRGNRAEALLDALIDALPALDPFDPVTIVVGSHLVSRWLQLALARARGIAAGIELVTFDRFVEQTWGDASLVSLDRAALAAAIASELADPGVLATLPPVLAYLGDDATSERAAPRRVQLAEQLAELAWQYASTRPDWLVAFVANRLPNELAGNTSARWQATLLARACRRVEAARDDARAVLAPMLPWARKQAALAAPAIARGVFVFGVSFFSRAQLDALTDLATTSEVTLYVLDPCEPLWDDAATRARAGTEADDPVLLSLWGRAIRDTLGALVERSAGDVEGAFVHEPARDARTALLADVSARQLPSGATFDDAGVTVLACPNARRELEAISHDVRARLDRDPSLDAWDVVVWLAGNADRYLALAPSAFDAVGVPCHLIDAPLDDPGRIGEAVLALLELPTSPLRRGDLLRVMTHPAVLAGHPHVDADDWIRWTDRLGIAHGADASARAGTYLEAHDQRFHWDQGVRRLALGAFMSGEHAVTIDNAELAPEDVQPDQHASAATYALLVRSLCADARWLGDHVATLAGWAEVLVGLVDAYLARSDASRELERVRTTLAGLARLDVDGRRLGFCEARELAHRRLRGTRADRGEALASGVTVAPMRTMRALPYRVAYVVGLDEGVVPAGDRRGSLDLREDTRAGDVSPRDRDRHAFLEIVLGARDALVLSHVARDAKSGQPLGPSSLVVELGDALAPYLGAASTQAALAMMTRTVPLHRYAEGEHGLAFSPRERWAVRTRDAVHAQLRARGVEVPSEDQLVALLADDALAPLRACLDVHVASDPHERAAHAPRSLSLAALRSFLDAPVQAWARTTLGLEDADDVDPEQHTSEPFHLDKPARATVLRDVLADELRDAAADLSASGRGPRTEVRGPRMGYADRAHALDLHGQFPVGVFGEVERQIDVDMVARWRAALADLGGPLLRLAFGRARSDHVELVPSLALALPDGRTIQVVGETELLARDQARHISIIPIVSSLKDKRSHYHLRGAIDHVVLAASGRAPAGHVHVIVDRDGKRARVEHDAWTIADARAYLVELVRELVDDAHGYFLPLPALAGALDGKTWRLDEDRQLGFGPIQRVDGLVLPADIAAIARRRLAPLVMRMHGEHGFAIGRRK
jgi:exodeoxyribonuclease V gamma subunit